MRVKKNMSAASHLRKDDLRLLLNKIKSSDKDGNHENSSHHSHHSHHSPKSQSHKGKSHGERTVHLQLQTHETKRDPYNSQSQSLGEDARIKSHNEASSKERDNEGQTLTIRGRFSGLQSEKGGRFNPRRSSHDPTTLSVTEAETTPFSTESESKRISDRRKNGERTIHQETPAKPNQSQSHSISSSVSLQASDISPPKIPSKLL
jgi:hypothetical protein